MSGIDKKILALINKPLELEKFIEDQRQDLILQLDMVRDRIQRQIDADGARIKFVDAVLAGKFDEVIEFWDKEVEFADKVKIIKKFFGKKLRAQKTARKKSIADGKRRKQNVTKKYPKKTGEKKKTTRKKKKK